MKPKLIRNMVYIFRFAGVYYKDYSEVNRMYDYDFDSSPAMLLYPRRNNPCKITISHSQDLERIYARIKTRK